LGGAAIAFYFVAIEPTVESVQEWNLSSGARERALTDYAKSGGAFRSASDAIALGTRQFGELAVPTEVDKRSLALSEAIDRILAKHALKDIDVSSRQGALSKGPLTEFLGSQASAEKLIREVSFASTPEETAKVVAALEREPLVTTIARLTIRQGDQKERADRLLRVNVVIESWAKGKKVSK
jgi:hypothetical protein